MDPRIEITQTPLVEHGGRFASFADASSAAITDFSVCLNAYGPAPVVLEAVRSCSIDEYPDRFSKSARHAAAYRWDRPAAEIVFGAGAAELIHAICFAYLNRGDAVVVAKPCFGEYERSASLCGAQVHETIAQGGADETALWNNTMDIVRTVTRTNAKLVFVASPTSPAGSRYHSRLLQLLADACTKCDCLLVLDQSYDAFLSEPAGTPALPGHGNVIHIRSLTKDHALAGIRVAFAVTTAAIAEHIERARVPWASSSVAQAAAIACMTDDALRHVAETTARLRKDAATMAVHCALRGIPTIPSSTHYLLIEVGNAKQTRERLMRERRILVRDCSSFGLPEYIRVAARTPSDNAQLLHAIDSTLAQHPIESAANSTSSQFTPKPNG